MVTGFKRLAVALVCVLGLALPGYAGHLDDYYLAAFGEQPGSAIEKALLSTATETTGVVQCGTPLKHGLSRDWNRLEATTRSILAKQLAAPVLADEATFPSSGGHFLIHYATSGSDAPTPAAGYTVSSWVQAVAATFENVYSQYMTVYGYHPPPGIPYNIYLRALSSLKIYGQTTSTSPAPSAGFANAYGSYIEIDKDFTSSVFHPQIYPPLQSLQITAAHEYHHAIQYGYNFFFDIWYAEATSTWYEDELYDNVNQIYSYLGGWFSATGNSLDIPVDSSAVTTGAGYSRWLFNRYLAEQYGTIVVRSAWEKLATLNSSNSGDIPMIPVLEPFLSSFGGDMGSDFFALAKRFYQQDQWTSHTSETGRIYTHPLVPTASYSDYPVTAASTPVPFVTLPHYSFVFYKFSPSSTIPAAAFSIVVNKTSGIATTVFKKVGNVISEVAPATDSSYTINGFNASNPASDEVMLLVVNTTNVDNHRASFSTAGQPVSVTEPPNIPASSLSQTTASAGGGGGGSCFIATAAYGSYLHPQVRVLRDFRDRYLLTNAPGRAFVEFYYHFSPPLADIIARHKILRILTRIILTPVVMIVAHPVMVGAALLLATSLYNPLRRRLKTAIEPA